MRLALTLFLLAATPPPLDAVSLDGGRAAPGAPTSTVVLFWRSDCAPCLAELADLSALQRAARPLHVQPVSVDDDGRQGAAVEALGKVGLRPSQSWRARGAAEPLLTAYGGAPARLPLAVAFDASGRVCGRRTGFLGYDHLRAWAQTCARPDAARR